MGPIVLNPPIPVRQPRDFVFNNPTILFVDENLRIMKNLGDFVLILVNSWFGNKPMVASTLIYE